MDITPAFLMRMVRETLLAPRAAAAKMLNFGFAPIVGWMSLLLMAVASTVLTHISFAMIPSENLEMIPPESRELLEAAMGSPIRTAMLLWVVLLISVHGIHKVGRWRGGKGSLQGAVVLVAWLQFIWLCLQIAQLVTQALLPPFSYVLGIFGPVLFLWLLTNFTAELHGFSSLGMTFLGIILTIIAVAVVVIYVSSLLTVASATGG